MDAWATLIRIRGDDTDSAAVFQGIGGGSLTLDAGSVTVTGGTTGSATTPQPAQATPIDATLWNAQNAFLWKEIAYMDELIVLWKTKQQKLPADNSIWEKIKTELSDWGGDLAGLLVLLKTGKIWLAACANWAGDLAIKVGLDYLQRLFMQGIAYAEAIADEDELLLKLPATREHYELRRAQIELHLAQIQIIFQQIALVETTIKETLGDATPPTAEPGTLPAEDPLIAELKQINETLAMIQAEDTIVQCPHTHDCIYTKSIVRDSVEDDD